MAFEPWLSVLQRCLGRLRAQILHSAVGRDRIGQVLVVLLKLHEIRDIEESVALQSNVDESRLHARQHAGYAAFVNGSCEGVFVLALEVDFCE
jgi:hypothetical protein